MRRAATWVVLAAGWGAGLAGRAAAQADSIGNMTAPMGNVSTGAAAGGGNVSAAGNTSAMTAAGAGFSEKQTAALVTATQAECAASAALAGEDWAAWEKARRGLFSALAELQKQFGYGGFQGAIQTAVQGWPALGKATDLTHARSAFVKVSDAMAQVVMAAQAGGAPVGKVVIFYCPMTSEPANGKWVQSAAPLRNPFWGKEMIDCGAEVKPGGG